MTDANASDALQLTRRGQLTGLFPAFLLYALAGEAKAASAAGRSDAGRWIARQDEIGRALAAGQMTPRAWALEVERLGRAVDVGGMVAELKQAQVRPAGEAFGNDPQKRFVRFVDAEGRPRRLAFGAALFAFQPQNVITPHAHRHMVSAHMVVEGRVRIRNFDRVADAPGAIVVRPTKDHVAALGDVSAMCEARDNVHWFTPVGGAATTFDVILSGLDHGQPDHVIEAVDVLGGRRLTGGAIAAPVMSFEASSARYTAEI